jgi:molybdopterin converting factor small subunit
LATYLPPLRPDGRALIDLPPGATVLHALRRLGIPDDAPRIVLVNGHDAEDGQALAPGDVVSAFPPLSGGCAARW